jgi:hypothetical protein
MPCSVHRRLVTALELAEDAVQREPACEQLFRDLDADPRMLLSGARFTVANARHELSICPDAEAFTVVGGRVTALCRSYAGLTDLEAAAVILHEALHHAGMNEYPLDEEAPTSSEITHLVRTRCGLDSGR